MAFDIIQIPHDDEGVRSYVKQYKAFRLLALETAPEAFGSTYARESAFADDVWYSRLVNPKAVTFIALEADRILSTLTAIGPLPCSPEESSPSADPWIPSSGACQSAALLHYRINGMFTLPEARSLGLAKALIGRAIKYGTDEANAQGKEFASSIAVDSDNPAARALYVKCEFVPIRVEDLSATRKVLLLKYSPSEKGVRG